MRKESAAANQDELRPEYDLSQLKGGVRGKYYRQATGGSMEAEIIEPEPELRLIVRPAPDVSAVAPAEFQKEVQNFAQALASQGIVVSTRSYGHDAAGGAGGLSVEFVFKVGLLGPVAIIQARILIEAILKLFAGGTPFEVRKRGTTIKGAARDVQRVLPAERLAELLQHPKTPRMKAGHE